MKSCKAYPGADCGSDHNPVISRIQLKLRKLRKPKSTPKLNIQLLKSDPTIKEAYAVEVSNKFQTLEVINTVEQRWEQLKDSITSAANSILPKKQQEAKKNG